MTRGGGLLTVDAAVARTLQQHLGEPRWLVAFSGGLD